MISDERSGEKREKSFFFLAFYIDTENLCFVLLCYNNYTCPLFLDAYVLFEASLFPGFDYPHSNYRSDVE